MTTAPPPTVQTLASLLEHHRLDSMLREAEIIRDYPAGDERVEEARKLIRCVLCEFAPGKIDAAARDQILNKLHFAAEGPPTGRLDEPMAAAVFGPGRQPADLPRR